MAFKFGELAKKIQEEKGYCCLATRRYDTISCKRYSQCDDSLMSQDKVHYLIEDGIFRILDGVTGWEGWYIEDILRFPTEDWFAACAGTPGRYDRLMVNGAEILAIINQLPDWAKAK